jgi:hypothetical protein
MKFWRHHTWRDFYFEYAIITIALLYYASYSYGQSINTRLAQSWIRANTSLLTSQFAQFGLPSIDGRVVPLSHDGGGVFETYATGRVGISRLWVEIECSSRHDFVAWVIEVVGGFFFEGMGGQGDRVEVVIEPSGEWDGFVWGVVRKGIMRRLRETRYDLVYLKSRDWGADGRGLRGLVSRLRYLRRWLFRLNCQRSRIQYSLPTNPL